MKCIFIQDVLGDPHSCVMNEVQSPSNFELEDGDMYLVF